MLKDSVLLEGVHYVRPLSQGLYLWEALEHTTLEGDRQTAAMNCMAE